VKWEIFDIGPLGSAAVTKVITGHRREKNSLDLGQGFAMAANYGLFCLARSGLHCGDGLSRERCQTEVRRQD
jgi:hypothetical protein